ncbi:hypothetical protein HUN42_00035 [Streptomyces phage Dagobah]|nr:hypothetical protein HUN42_00035 [Streptomyces phage Dagobah]
MTAEETAAVEWLENLSPAERRERFLPAAVAMMGCEPEDRIATFATLKDDHEVDRAHCWYCEDPNTVVVA